MAIRKGFIPCNYNIISPYKLKEYIFVRKAKNKEVK
jgi:hypothetical protein